MRLVTGLLLVAFCGLGIAAFRTPTGFWASTTYSLALLLIAIASALSFQPRRAPRLKWRVAAIFGIIYFVAAFVLAGKEDAMSRPLFITQYALIKTEDQQIRILSSVTQNASRPQNQKIMFGDSETYLEPPIEFGFRGPRIWDLLQLRQIMHAYITILFMLVGCLFGSHLARKSNAGGPDGYVRAAKP